MDVKQMNERPTMTLGQKYNPMLPAHLQGEPTVTMVFPHKMGLQLDDGGGYLQFQEGVQEVPQSVAQHPHLRKNGAKPYAKPALPNAAEEAALIERLRARGYYVAPPTAESETAAAIESSEKLDANRPRTAQEAAAANAKAGRPLTVQEAAAAEQEEEEEEQPVKPFGQQKAELKKNAAPTRK
jgi:hypothetical protein